jgi:hypothetical protein
MKKKLNTAFMKNKRDLELRSVIIKILIMLLTKEKKNSHNKIDCRHLIVNFKQITKYYNQKMTIKLIIYEN